MPEGARRSELMPTSRADPSICNSAFCPHAHTSDTAQMCWISLLHRREARPEASSINLNMHAWLHSKDTATLCCLHAFRMYQYDYETIRGPGTANRLAAESHCDVGVPMAAGCSPCHRCPNRATRAGSAPGAASSRAAAR